MTPEAAHKVGRVVLRCASVLETDFSGAGEEGNGKSGALLSLCRERLPALLQEVFDEALPRSDPRIMYRDSLKLNLGSLTLDEFFPRLRKALREELPPRTHPANVVTETQRLPSLLAAYLESGFSPWNTLDFSPERWSAAMSGLLDDARKREELLARLSGSGTPLAARRLRFFLQGLGIRNSSFDHELRKIEKSVASRNARPEAAAEIPFAAPSSDVFINNAGLILLSPFLSAFFQRLGLLDARKRFLDEQAQSSAVWSLHRIFTPERTALVEGETPLNKLLCGLPISEPVPPPSPELLDSAGQEAPVLLRSVIGHWPGLDKATPETFIREFLLRGGVLRFGSERHLHVETAPRDIALHSLPWTISIIQTPWMDKPLMAHWP